MTITVKKNETVIYSQVLDDSKTMNATIAFLMTQPTGDAVRTTVANNGHEMNFSTAEFPVGDLVRKVNDIVARKKKEA